MHPIILKEMESQFLSLIPILAEQNEATVLSSYKFTEFFNTQIIMSVIPPVQPTCFNSVKELRKLQIDVDGKEAQIHFPNSFSLTLPSENLTLSTIYMLIDHIQILINYIERLHNGPSTD